MSNFYDDAEKAFIRLEDKLTLVLANMKGGFNQNPDDVFFDNQEFLQIMHISKRTAQQWRDNGYIGYSQLGNKIYYHLTDIKALLKDNYNPKK